MGLLAPLSPPSSHLQLCFFDFSPRCNQELPFFTNRCLGEKTFELRVPKLDRYPVESCFIKHDLVHHPNGIQCIDLNHFSHVLPGRGLVVDFNIELESHLLRFAGKVRNRGLNQLKITLTRTTWVFCGFHDRFRRIELKIRTVRKRACFRKDHSHDFQRWGFLSMDACRKAEKTETNEGQEADRRC